MFRILNSFPVHACCFCKDKILVSKRNKEAERSSGKVGFLIVRQSYSSVGQSATLIMWRSAVQVCLGLRPFPVSPGD